MIITFEATTTTEILIKDDKDLITEKFVLHDGESAERDIEDTRVIRVSEKDHRS